MGGACCSADDRRFGNRRVDYTRFTELRLKAISDLEGTAVLADILAQAEDVGIPLHLFEEAFTNRLEISDLRHREFPSLPGAHSHRLPHEPLHGTTTAVPPAGRHKCQRVHPLAQASERLLLRRSQCRSLE
jgi:hypothetical protein